MFGIEERRDDNVAEAARFLERCMDGRVYAVSQATQEHVRVPSDYLLGLRSGIELVRTAEEHPQADGQTLVAAFLSAYAETQEEE